MSLKIKPLLISTAILCTSILLFASCAQPEKVATNKTDAKKPEISKTTKPAETVEINIADFAYSLEKLTVSKGTKVIWKNKDSVAHTVTSSDEKFDSGLFGQGKEFSYTFDTPGTYPYFCIPHPQMKAQIIVKEEN